MALGAAGLGEGCPPPLRTVAWRAWVFGTVFHFATLYWTGWVAIPGMLAMVAILGLYVAVVFVGCAYLERAWGARAIWLFPFLWVGHEYLRGLGALAFPWTNLSLSQVGYHDLVQYADLTGDLGVSFMVALMNVAVLRLIHSLNAGRRRPALWYSSLLAAGLVLPLIYARLALPGLTTTDTVRVAVLQGDIDSFHKWDEGWVDQSMATYETQTRDAAAHGADLIIWPETAAPMYLRAEEEYHRQLRLLSERLSVSMLIGTLEFQTREPEGYLRYNAAVAIDHGVYQRDYHAKMQLVPFGEWIPFSNRWRVLDKLEVGGAHFSAGNRYVLFDHPQGPYAAAICYESIFPDIIRHFVLNGARFLVNITNDGWYGFSSGPTQHAAIAILRAIETRRPIARAANTGVSGFIDRTGRFIEATAQYVPDVRICDLPLGPKGEETFFVRHGMYVGQSCTAIPIVVLIFTWLSNRRRRGMMSTASLVLFGLVSAAWIAQASPVAARDWTNYTNVRNVTALAAHGDTLWASTTGGLVRMIAGDSTDDRRFTNADGLGENDLRFVATDSLGTIWTGGGKGRLSHRRSDQDWDVFRFESEADAPIGLNAATPGPDGFLWVGSDVGVHKFDTRRHGGEIKESYTRIGDWVDGSPVNDLRVAQGYIWAVGPAGIARGRLDDPFLLDRTHWQTWSQPDSLKTIAEFLGTVFVGGGGGLDEYDSAGSLWVHKSLDANPVGVNDLYADGDTLWIATALGQAWLTASSQGGGPIPHGIRHEFTSIVHLADGTLWLGRTDSGIWEWQSGVWTNFSFNGPLDDNFADVALGGDGTLWCVHPVAGADFLRNGRWTSLPYYSNAVSSSAPGTSVDVAPNGDVWLGAWGLGAFRVNPSVPLADTGWVRYDTANSTLMWVQTADRRPNDYVVIRDVSVDARGRVWFANSYADSGRALAFFDHGCWGVFDSADGFTTTGLMVLHALDNSVIVGTADIGLVEEDYGEPLCADGQPRPQRGHLSTRDTRDGLPSNQVQSLLIDRADSLWAGTSLGLARYAADRRRFFDIPLPAEAGLAVSALAADASNTIWVGTTLGLVMISPDGATEFFNSDNSGLPGDNVQEIQVDDRTGQVWVATQGGLSRTLGPLPAVSDLAEIVAYPNPFELTQDLQQRVRFNAPYGSHVYIVTVAGAPVTDFDAGVGWDGRTVSGHLVVSGIYVFVVSGPDGQYGRGKIAVLRR
ncbi:MAG: apolipoprotein N-acyltransferase [candidate division Zixibacteria bacterium]|nr:apolipoprotein N-acyltransferase [candidate division Zixibacteria bacterium]